MAEQNYDPSTIADSPRGTEIVVGVTDLSAEGSGNDSSRFNLNNKHPDYVATESDRKIGRDLYEGSSVVCNVENVKKYLTKSESEAEKHFKIRCSRAVLDPWVKKIIACRMALLTNKSPSRELPSELEGLEDDATRSGISANEFFEDVVKNAQIDGIRWVCVDMPEKRIDPETGEAIQTTKADDDAVGFRPFFVEVPANSVLDWCIGDDGFPEWILIRENTVVSRKDRGWGYKQKTKPRWKIWTRNEWVIYTEREGKEGKATKEEDYEMTVGVHGLGHVPMVPFLGEMNTEYSGWPIARSILRHVLLLFNKESDLDWFEFVTAHPIPYTWGPKRIDKLITTQGMHLSTVGPDDTSHSAGASYLEPSGASSKAMRESISDIRYRILNIALAQAKKDSAQVQSAEGQREDRRMFSSSLKSVSMAAQHAEERCWFLAFLWLHSNSPSIKLTDVVGKTIIVQYNRDFDDRTIEVAMIKELKDLVLNELLPLETLWEKLKYGEVLDEDFDAEEAKKMIEEQSMKRAAGLMPGAPPNDFADQDQDGE